MKMKAPERAQGLWRGHSHETNITHWEECKNLGSWICSSDSVAT